MSMISTDNDPLRFLKPRKKQFHLTPTKPIKSSSPQHNQNNAQYNHLKEEISKKSNIQNNNISHNNIAVSVVSVDNAYANISNINTSSDRFSQELIEIQKDINSIIGNTNNNTQQPEQCSNSSNNLNKKYNPKRYFSIKVENYLRKKHGLSLLEEDIKENEQEKDYLKSTKQNEMQSINEHQQLLKLRENNEQQPNFKVEKQTISVTSILLQEESVHDDNNDTEKESSQEMESFFVVKNAQLQKGNSKNNRLSEKLEKPEEQSEHQCHEKYEKEQEISFNYQESLRNGDNENVFKNRKEQLKIREEKEMENQYKEEENLNQNEGELREVELQPCPICTRKFNPNSFEKHVKVCEKVFYKKRKEFSSEKQRSLSSNKRK